MSNNDNLNLEELLKDIEMMEPNEEVLKIKRLLKLKNTPAEIFSLAWEDCKVLENENFANQAKHRHEKMIKELESINCPLQLKQFYSETLTNFVCAKHFESHLNSLESSRAKK